MWISTAAVTALLIAACGISLSESGVALGKANERNGNCLGPDDNEYSTGDSWYHADQCMKSTCTEMNGQLYVSMSGCGTVSAHGENCHVVRGSGNYPDCCPTVKCEQ